MWKRLARIAPLTVTATLALATMTISTAGCSDSSPVAPAPPDLATPPDLSLPFCAAAEQGLQDITGTPASPYFVHHPDHATPDTPTVIFLPGGSGSRDIAASYIFKNWISRGKRLGELRVIVPYSDSDDFPGELDRVVPIVDEVLACYGGARDKVHLAGTSNGGRGAYQTMLAASDRFATLLGAPGLFPGGASDGDLKRALLGKSIYNGAGELDSDWRPPVEKTDMRLQSLGLDSIFVVFPQQGHILNSKFNPDGFFEFWLTR